VKPLIGWWASLTPSPAMSPAAVKTAAEQLAVEVVDGDGAAV